MLSIFKSQSNKYKLSFLIGLSFLAIIFTTVLFIFIRNESNKQKIISAENTISELRIRALKYKIKGNLDQAESLCNEALKQAKFCQSNIEIIEFLSRLVQIKLFNHKLVQTDALTQRALKLALTLKDSSTTDSSLEIWMDDMANCFYKRGEFSIQDNTKKFCLEHYLEIKLSMDSKPDSALISRAIEFTKYCNMSGNYSEAIYYNKRLIKYLERVDLRSKFDAYLGLSFAYLLANQPIAAEDALKKQFQISEVNNTNMMNGTNDSRFFLYYGHAKEEENDFAAAQRFYMKALQLQKQSLDKLSSLNDFIYNGLYRATLGSLEYRLGNLNEANKLLQDGLSFFKKCPVPQANSKDHPEGIVYSGQVFCLERLAEVATKEHSLHSIESFQSQAKIIRDKNPYWAESENTDPNAFYMVAACFPYKVEIMPTRFSF